MVQTVNIFQNGLLWSDIVKNGSKLSKKGINDPKKIQTCPIRYKFILKLFQKITAVGVTATGYI